MASCASALAYHRCPVGAYPGMNRDITLEQSTPLAVLVPKSAVVLCSDRAMVFVYDPTQQLA